MPITLYYPDRYYYYGGNSGIAIIILRKTPCYIYCEIYNYDYEDGGCVFGSQININQKRYKITNLNTECEGIFVKNIGIDYKIKCFPFINSKTLEQALEYHESNNDVDASI